MDGFYTVKIYNKNWKLQKGTDGTLARTLTQATNIVVRERLNRPNQILFEVPFGSSDAASIEIGRVVRILDGTELVSSGIILGPVDKTTDFISVMAFDKSEILNRSITPYEFLLESTTAIGQVRELLKNYHYFRQWTDADFNDGTYSDTEVLTIAGTGNEGDEYFIVLDETNEVYEASGTYLSKAILCTHPFFGDPENVARLRYLAELGNDTGITVAFRHSNDASTTSESSVSNWSSWSSEYDLSTQDTDTLGITSYNILVDDFRWVQVRFSFSTDDTTITPALQAFEIICEYDMEITEASDFVLTGAQVDTTFSEVSHLEAIRQIVSLRNSEFRVNDDYELEIAEKFGVTTPTATFEVGTNCNVVEYQEEDRLLSTAILALSKDGRGIAKSAELNVDAAASVKFGFRPWTFIPVGTTQQEIDDELDERKELTLRVTLEEIATTLLDVNIGDIVNFEHDDRGIDTTLRVVGIRTHDSKSGDSRYFELVSHEGFFAREPEFEEVVSTTGDTGLLGEDGIGEERIYAITDTANGIANSKLPDNDWGYNEGGTVDSLEWHTIIPITTSENPFLWIATRKIIGQPETGDTVDDDWIDPKRLSIADLDRFLDEYPLDVLEWRGLPPISIATDETGQFAGTLLLNISDYLVNTTEGDETISVVSKSSNIASATYDAINDEIDISVNNLLGHANGTVNIRASVTIDSTTTTTDSIIRVRLLFVPIEGQGSTGFGDTGMQGDTGIGDTGMQGDTGFGEQGDTGVSITGEQGDTGSESTTPGPQGDTGSDSTVPGPASTVPGPKGDTGL